MRSGWGVVLFFLAAAGVRAESPDLLLAPPPAPVVEQAPVTPLPAGNASASGSESPGVGLQHWVDGRLVLGFPTGVQLQVALDRNERRTWVAEAFAGYELFNPIIGCGGRVLFTPATGRHDALVIGPGFDFLYYFGDHSGGENFLTGGHNGYFFIPDVEIAWLHDFADHFGWEIGLNVGLGLALWEGDSDGPGRATALPLLNVFTGFNF